VERWRPHGIRTNAEVSGSLLRKKFRLAKTVTEPLRFALDRGLLSQRGADRVQRVAWTLADLAGRTSPALEDVTTALSFRQDGGAR
jgi:magnesium chelatase family protein